MNCRAHALHGWHACVASAVLLQPGGQRKHGSCGGRPAPQVCPGLVTVEFIPRFSLRCISAHMHARTSAMWATRDSPAAVSRPCRGRGSGTENPPVASHWPSAVCQCVARRKRISPAAPRNQHKEQSSIQRGASERSVSVGSISTSVCAQPRGGEGECLCTVRSKSAAAACVVEVVLAKLKSAWTLVHK